MYFSGDYPNGVLPALVKFMVQKKLCRQSTHTSTMPLDIIVALKQGDELKGVALVMAFFTRHDEKWGVNQSEVNWRRFLILNQPIEIDMKSGNIF